MKRRGPGKQPWFSIQILKDYTLEASENQPSQGLEPSLATEPSQSATGPKCSATSQKQKYILKKKEIVPSGNPEMQEDTKSHEYVGKQMNTNYIIQ